MGAWDRFDRKFRILPGTPEACLVAAFLVALAALLRWALGLLDVTLQPFTTFYPAVLFATYVGGVGAGSLAAILGGLIGWGAFMPPQFFSSVHGPELEVIIYSFASGLLIWGAESYRGLAQRLQNEEQLRKLAVEELAHRLKNKIATIQSIVGYQLREQPKVRDDIVARLAALSATDDLLTAAQGEGANIRAILTAELGPYDISRMSMKGPDVLLAPKLALTMALLIHELTTDAAKHGALSNTHGKLSIYWSVSDGILNIEWRESDGPFVGVPTRRGFGLRLLSNALDQFGGSVETIFEKTGIICTMKSTLSKESSMVPEERAVAR